jgi:PAS domain S-box-containing protein
VIDGEAYGTSAVATCTRDRATVLGRFVALTPLDDIYLAGRHPKDTSISFSLIAAGTPVAESGAQPPPAEVRRLASQLQEAAKSTVAQDPRSATIGDRFVGAAPVVLLANEPPKLVIIASSPTSTILATQNRLFRTLFLIALLGALAALLLAAAVGERIGSRLRRLTAAAEGVSRGDPGVRANLAGDDEVGTLGATFDAMAGSIEEKTAAETALRGRIEAVVAGMAEALVATDADARITDFNQAAEDLIGVSAATARGRDVLEVVTLSADDGSDLQARLKKPPRTRWTASGILHAIDGPALPVAVSGGPLRDADGVVVGGVVLLRDLRGEREVERMKTEFLSRIGHELRTPLTGVLGYADLLLRREWPPERSRMMLEEVHASARRLERIVELLEFFAAAAAGRTLLRLREVDIRGLVDGVYRSWEPRVEPPVQLARKLSRGLPKVVADPRWLRMALDELVDNAKKFSPGGGRIVVGAQVVDDGRVEVFVADHGVGMSAEEVGLAFDDFQQGDTSDTRSFGGLGLGLPLVQRVTEGHGGEVRCATTPGRGTRLSILLPVVEP